MAGLAAGRRVPVLQAQVGDGGRAGGHEVAVGSGRLSRGWKRVVSPRLHCRQDGAVHGVEGRSSETRERISVNVQEESTFQVSDQCSAKIKQASSSGLQSPKHHYRSHGLSCQTWGMASAASAAFMEPSHSKPSDICLWRAQWVPSLQLLCWGCWEPTSPFPWLTAGTSCCWQGCTQWSQCNSMSFLFQNITHLLRVGWALLVLQPVSSRLRWMLQLAPF